MAGSLFWSTRGCLTIWAGLFAGWRLHEIYTKIVTNRYDYNIVYGIILLAALAIVALANLFTLCSATAGRRKLVEISKQLLLGSIVVLFIALLVSIGFGIFAKKDEKMTVRKAIIHSSIRFLYQLAPQIFLYFVARRTASSLPETNPPKAAGSVFIWSARGILAIFAGVIAGWRAHELIHNIYTKRYDYAAVDSLIFLAVLLILTVVDAYVLAAAASRNKKLRKVSKYLVVISIFVVIIFYVVGALFAFGIFGEKSSDTEGSEEKKDQAITPVEQKIPERSILPVTRDYGFYLWPQLLIFLLIWRAQKYAD